MHPVVVREEAGKLWLVAGERRLRAIKDLYELNGGFKYDNRLVEANCIPVVTLGELGELEREEAELEENTRRADLSWPEQAVATARLSDLRSRQAGLEGRSPPGVAAVAAEVRGSSTGRPAQTTRRELIVAKHLDNPAVRGAKTLDEAFKVLKRQEAGERNAELAATVGRTFSSADHTLIHGDSLGWLASCPDGQFDVILTDPPYGMGADEFGDSGGRAAGAHGYADTAEIFNKCLDFAALHFIRVTKPQAHLYWFCDIDKFHVSRSYFEDAGWWVHRTPLIWHKMQGTRTPWPEHGPMRKYEILLYAVKGKKPVTKIFPDVITVGADTNLGHGAQKPVALYEQLLVRSVQAGDAVLDCFGGTGPILPAAHTYKCRATYVERDAASYGIAVERLKNLDVQSNLEGLK